MTRIAAMILLALLFLPNPQARAQARAPRLEGMVTLPGSGANEPANASIEGTVVADATGEPLPGATVRIARRFSSVIAMLLEEQDGARAWAPVVLTTDRQGRFVATGLASGDYELATAKQGYFPEPLAAPGLQYSVQLLTGQHLGNVAIRLKKSASLTGTLRDAAGNPAGGIAVQLLQRNGAEESSSYVSRARNTTAADGSYWLEGFGPGSFVLAAGSRVLNGRQPEINAREITILDTETRTQDLRLEAAGAYAIHGRIRFAETTALPPEVTLETWVTSGDGSQSLSGLNTTYNPQTGDFTIPGLSSGLYMVQLSAPGCGQTSVLISGQDTGNVELNARQDTCKR